MDYNLSPGRQRPETIRAMEKALIKRTLEFFEYNVTRSARNLGISKETLYRRLRQYGIKEETLKLTRRGRRYDIVQWHSTNDSFALPTGVRK